LKNYCINCNQILKSRAKTKRPKRCWDCHIKFRQTDEGRKSCHFTTGWRSSKAKFYCKDCNNEVSVHSYLGEGRCLSCARKGKLHHSYNKLKKLYYCIDCGKKLVDYRSKRCGKCSNINNLKFIRSKYTINKPENLLNKLLQKLFVKEYKFVGNGEIILDRFNPDFINISGQKKIIELYGDYWHNRKENKERDKRRIISYTKLGYRTLIVWEHELKDLTNLKQKICKFHFK